MTDLRTAAQQALETLRHVVRQAQENLVPTIHYGPVSDVMNRLEAALAQQAEPRNQCRSDGRCQYAIDHGAEGIGHCPKSKCVMAQHTQPAEDRDVAQSNLRVMKEMFREQTEPAQQAEAVQEPVAVFDARWGQPVLLSGAPLLEDEQPLYTAPPQRKPLTEEEIRDLWSWAMTAEAERTATTQQHAFARAIERAHGIGGSDA